MLPTIFAGDHIFVEKSVNFGMLPAGRRIPQRGDVIVFAHPMHPDVDFIMRVIALPGDHLEVRDGHPWINGWEVPSCRVGDWSYQDDPVEQPFSAHKHEGAIFVEYLGSHTYLTLYEFGGFLEQSKGPWTAFPNELCVLGDNRYNSYDSRWWWEGQGGGLPFANVRGRALFVWLAVQEGKLAGWRFGLDLDEPTLPADAASLQPQLDACLAHRPKADPPASKEP